MVTTVNDRFREAIKALKDTYDQIEEATGISRSTLIRMTKPKASIKIEHIDLLDSKYDTFDGDFVKTGKKSVPPEAHTETVQSTAHFDQVNEEEVEFKAFIKKHPRGSAASKLKPEDYDNPIVILNAAVNDIRKDWEGPVRKLPKEERQQWLREALEVINRIASKHLDKIDDQE